VCVEKKGATFCASHVILPGWGGKKASGGKHTKRTEGRRFAELARGRGGVYRISGTLSSSAPMAGDDILKWEPLDDNKSGEKNST